MIVTCDTNFYRKLVEKIKVNDINRLDSIIKKVIQAEKAKGVKAMMGSIVASEILSHLVDDPSDYSFQSCLKACYVLYKHCEENNQFRLLPSPQTQISFEYFNKSNIVSEQSQNTLGQILSEITKSPTLYTIKKYDFQLQQNKRHIKETEDVLIEEIQDFCRKIDPTYSDWKLFVNDKNNRNKYIKYINSNSFAEETAKAMLCAVYMQINPGIDVKSALVNIQSKMVKTFIQSYAVALSLRRFFWLQLLNPGFNLKEKSRANFLWDEQILYFVGKSVEEEKIILVTSDKKMLDAAKSCNEGNSVMNYDEYLHYLCVDKDIEAIKLRCENIVSCIVKSIIVMDFHDLQYFFKVNGRIYTFLNPVSYLTALKHKDLFGQFDGIFADGSILVKAVKLLYGKQVTRRSFDMTSMAPEILSYAEENGKTVYIVASKQEQVEKAVDIFTKLYPRLKFAGYRNGYFSSESEKDEEARHIAELNPDFLIVGMGTLAQEQFLLKVKEVGYKGIGFTCGGFIHQTAKNKIDYYPAWVDRTNLRFVYRMYKEPHTRKRYLQAALLFPARFIWERFFG